MISWAKKTFPNLEIIAGNVVTREQAANLIELVLMVSVLVWVLVLSCITQEVMACGRPQLPLSTVSLNSVFASVSLPLLWWCW